LRRSVIPNWETPYDFVHNFFRENYTLKKKLMPEGKNYTTCSIISDSRRKNFGEKTYFAFEDTNIIIRSTIIRKRVRHHVVLKNHPDL